MLASLFGDLNMAKAQPGDEPWPDTQGSGEAGNFAATAMLESTATSVNDQGQMVDRHVKDLFVTGSPAQAMRAHFATHSSPEAATHAITLYDPVGLWAPATIKALSDSSGQPIERLHLRDRNSLRTLAMIERTRVVRRFDHTLKIYHVDERSSEPEHADIPVVLMERAQLTAVIVGPMHAESVERMLALLQGATRAPTWRCPRLLFMLPPAAVWIAGKVNAIAWPETLEVTVLNQTLSSTSAVWNALLDMWNLGRRGDTPGAETFGDGVPGHSEPAALNAFADTQSPPEPAVRPPLRQQVDVAAGRALLQSVAQQDGVLACALLDAGTGAVLTSEMRDREALDLAHAAGAASQLLRAQRLVASDLGLPEPLDEIVLSAGSRQQVLRPLAKHPGLVVYALLDGRHGNLALLRYRLTEGEKALG